MTPRGTGRYRRGMAGLSPRFTDEAERFVLDVCQGALDVPGIAARLPRFAR